MAHAVMTLRRVVKKPACHRRRRVSGMGWHIASGNGVKSV
jgi:hypothetical protein